ncbi:MAG: hypothetical protein NT027_19865, partial [Proteobacteria bacterium]|nr:hypothetical protein [Pseudomonadota bacterium]
MADYFGAVGPFVESKVQIEATFECLSDVFKLYFAMQIARVSRKHILPWFILGVIISSIFGLLVSTVSSSEKELVAFLFTFKNTMVGLFAAWLCFRVGFAIIPEKIPWRVLALFLAAVGFIFEPFRTIFLIAIENNVDARHIANMSSLETFTNFVF